MQGGSTGAWSEELERVELFARVAGLRVSRLDLRVGLDLDLAKLRAQPIDVLRQLAHRLAHRADLVVQPRPRDRHKGSPYWDDCAEFCERWDQSSFDPDYETLPVEFFRPFVIEVFARKAYDPSVIRAGERVALVNPEIAKERSGAPA